jgi:hypothetical protein
MPYNSIALIAYNIHLLPAIIFLIHPQTLILACNSVEAFDELPYLFSHPTYDSILLSMILLLFE